LRRERRGSFQIFSQEDWKAEGQRDLDGGRSSDRKICLNFGGHALRRKYVADSARRTRLPPPEETQAARAKLDSGLEGFESPLQAIGDVGACVVVFPAQRPARNQAARPKLPIPKSPPRTFGGASFRRARDR